MEDRKKTKSFWTTLPGIITACASLIIAISTILGTLKATDSWPFSRQELPVVNFFDASKSTIEAGQSCTLSWDVAGAAEININPGFENVPLTGNREVSPTETTTPQPPPEPMDPTLLLMIGGAIGVVIVVLVIFTKRR